MTAIYTRATYGANLEESIEWYEIELELNMRDLTSVRENTVAYIIHLL